MSKIADLNIKVQRVFFRENKIFFALEDGREIGAPLDWYPNLEKATDSQRYNFSISPGGYGVHWEELDEDLSAIGMLSLGEESKKQIK
ncbi:DUF2442 domain-containing protein [Zunongwangia sp. F363]|uniref:DUF2442 domain-containing protein n=1 Tax=Autumnicola tepida TaxID=3075595 RepID=A0ABU3C4K9_9FLAO|nr:DUF2442 domain-containing protein [Zunongwangia sp. F363]MDT0641274.1 DUF2442 domain-containing protein [Zunongwangia sp. F363]